MRTIIPAIKANIIKAVSRDSSFMRNYKSSIKVFRDRVDEKRKQTYLNLFSLGKQCHLFRIMLNES